jgi:hypothetical protein
MAKSVDNTNNNPRTDSFPGGGGGIDDLSGGVSQLWKGQDNPSDLTRTAVEDSLSESDLLDIFNTGNDDSNTTPPAQEDGQNPGEYEVRENDDDLDQSDDNSDDSKDNQNNNDGNEPAKGSSETEDESELIEPFVDLLHEELGWEVDDEEKPKSISEFVDYIKSVVDQNAQNNFASEEVAQLNEYIRSGGDIHSFYSSAYGAADVDIDRLDISDVQNQRYVVANNLRNKGYSDERINRTISRFEDSGILEEEAEDAVVELKETVERNRQAVVEQQRQQAEQQRYEEVEFFNGVKEEVSKIDNVRGLPITRQDRDQLLRYIFQRDRDGVTQYQRDYYKDLKRNLIESAYFTMKGDSLVNGVKQKAETNAARALRERLKSKTTYGKNSKAIEKEVASSSIWDSIANKF